MSSMHQWYSATLPGVHLVKEAAHPAFAGAAPRPRLPLMPSGAQSAARASAGEADVEMPARQSTARVLVDLMRPTLISQAFAAILVLPGQDRIVCDLPDEEALLKTLLSDWSRRYRAVDPLGTEIDRVRFRFGARLSSVAWSLALREEGVDAQRWSRDGCAWRITSWPRFDRWPSSPDTMRLAAMFAVRSATVERASAVVKVPPARVAAFLSACEVCGIPVVADHDKQPAGHEAHLDIRGSQLARLRAQLKSESAFEFGGA